MPEPTDDSERRTVADVQQHGWHVVKVMEDDEGPAFAYTVGLFHTFGHPELIVVGMPLEAGHAVLNIAGEAIRGGRRYTVDATSDEFIEDRACTFRRMPKAQYEAYLGWALWFYDGPSFPALQMVWADRDGRWPWDEAADADFREDQPVIEIAGTPPWALRRLD